MERVTLADNGLGIEAHAREARYRAFAQTLLPGEVLATAQHLDDQCETFLLALKRGSGPAGLSAMGERSPFAGTLLLRPLLRETRKTLEQWAVRHGLCWIEDESNQDDAYDRNFLRLRALPLLQQRWPHFPAAVARSATLCAEQERLLDELLASDLTDCITAEGTLRLSPLMSMSDVRRAAILRRWLAMRNAPMPLATRWNVSGRRWRWRATMPLPVYALAITRFAVTSRNCGGLNPWPDNTKRRSPGPSGKHRWRCLPA